MAVGAPSADAEVLPDIIRSFDQCYITKTGLVMEGDLAVAVIAVRLLAHI